MTQKMRGRGPAGAVQKPQKSKEAFIRLIKELKPWRARLVVAAVFALLSSVLSIFLPKMVAQATNLIFEGLILKIKGIGGIPFDQIAQILLTMAGLTLLSFVFGVITQRAGADVSADISLSLRQKIDTKLHLLPISYFERNAVGDVLSRVVNDVDSVAQNISNAITQTLTGIATILGIVVMMLSLSPLLTLLVVLSVPLSGALMGLVFSRSQRFFSAQQKTMGELNAIVEESYGGQSVIQAFLKEKELGEVFRKKNDELFENAWKSQFFSGLMHPLSGIVTNVAYLMVTVVGAAQAASGALSVGVILAFIQYVRSFMQPLGQMSQMMGQLQTMAAASERVFQLLDEPEEDRSCSDEKMAEVKGEICFEKVSFGYEKGKEIIKDFSLCVKPGQTCAIVGETGSGKTTLMKLLMRFYDPDSGRILLDGRDLRSLSREDLRGSIGMVLQDTWLFSGSIEDNLRYGRLEATREEIVEAAKRAHADHFIRTLPNGYGLVLNEDTDNLSAGQKQLITIARAFLADRPILILDEATSNVDTLTEQRIQKAMRNLMKGRTNFVIAHRLSTIKNADIILLLEDGRIVESGNHEALMEKGGAYKALYESQFGEG